MARNNTIKIDADFKSVTKGFSDLSKSAKDLGNKKINLNVDDKKLREAMKFQKDIIESTQKEIQRLSVAIHEAFDDKHINKFKNRINELKRDIREATSSLGDMGGGGGRIGGGGGGGGGLLGGFVGKAGLAGLIGGAVAGAVRFVVGPLMQASSSRLQLRGQGMTTQGINEAEKNGAYLGYSPTDTRQQASSLMRATGGAGQLGSVQMFSRAIGADPSDLIGMMGSMRSSGMNDKQSMTALKDMFVDAVSAGFDSSRAIDVLQTISEQTATMAKSGDVSVAGMRNTMTALMNSSSYFRQNPDRAMGAMSGMNQFFTGGGPASALGFGAISDLYPGASNSKKLWEMNRGLGKDANSPERLRALMGRMLNRAAPGQNISFGGGVNQLSEDQRMNLSMNMGRQSGLSQETVREMLEGYLSGNLDELKMAGDEAVDLQQKIVTILDSSDAKMAQMAASLEYIRLGLSDSLLNLGNLNPFGSTSSFGPRSSLAKSFQSSMGVSDISAGGVNVPMTSSLAGSFASLGGGGSTLHQAIIDAEGTGAGGRDPYNTVLGYGKYGSPDKPLTEMTLSEVRDFGMKMRKNPKNPFNSSAVGAFQILATSTMGDAAKALGYGEDTVFTPQVQQNMANWIAETQGLGAWEGFKQNPKALSQARGAMASGSLDIVKGPTKKASGASGGWGGADISNENLKELVKHLKQQQEKKPVIKSEITKMSGHSIHRSEPGT